jgi:hypothetical protein
MHGHAWQGSWPLIAQHTLLFCKEQQHELPCNTQPQPPRTPTTANLRHCQLCIPNTTGLNPPPLPPWQHGASHTPGRGLINQPWRSTVASTAMSWQRILLAAVHGRRPRGTTACPHPHHCAPSACKAPPLLWQLLLLLHEHRPK